MVLGTKYEVLGNKYKILGTEYFVLVTKYFALVTSECLAQHLPLSELGLNLILRNFVQVFEHISIGVRVAMGKINSVVIIYIMIVNKVVNS